MEESRASPKKITSGTKEWADHNVNCFRGCSNNCRYCYAKMMAKRFGRATDSNWDKMVIRKGILGHKFSKYKGRVMFPSTHDIVDQPEVKKVCFSVLTSLLEADNKVLITTKPSYNVTKEIIEKFNHLKDRIQFRFTITSNKDRILSFWEPNAPSFKERYRSLEYAFENDYKTSVSIEPFLDFEPQRLVEKISPLVTESIWIGPMNYIARNKIEKVDLSQYEETRKNYEISNLSRIYEDLRNEPLIRFKDSMTIKLKLPNTNRTCR